MVIAGPDEVGLKADLEQLTEELGVRDKVIFTGFIETASKRCMPRAATFVLPSYSEGFSSSVLEIMCFSKRVIITNGCDFPEVASESAGLIVETNPHELAEAINRVLSKPELA